MTDPSRVGHRARMRHKLEKHGEDVFETYELLEMLLYHSIPVKDTRSLSKRLIARFGGIDGVFSASAEELMLVDGVGAASAALIATVAELPEAMKASLDGKVVRFDDYEVAGRFVHTYFKGKSEKSVIMLSLDANMELIGVDEICAVDFDSAGVKPGPMIKIAVERRANAVILAHNHPFGALLPSEGDRQTSLFVSNALGAAGICLAENYVVNDEGYFGFEGRISFAFLQKSAIDRFAKSKLRALEANASQRGADEPVCEDYLSSLLRFVLKDEAPSAAARLYGRAGTLYRVFETEFLSLSTLCSERAAFLLRVSVAVSGRRYTERLLIGRKNSEDRITDHLRGYFLGKSVEHVYAILLDERERVIVTEQISVGTVGVSEILPRKLLDIVSSHGADAVILAHNHPSGAPSPSLADGDANAAISRLLKNVGVTLAAHYVVAPRGVCNILDGSKP